MEKVIRITGRCDEDCYFYRNNPTTDKDGSIEDNEECIIGCGHYDDTNHLYPINGSCPARTNKKGDGLHRLTLEKIEEDEKRKTRRDALEEIAYEAEIKNYCHDCGKEIEPGFTFCKEHDKPLTEKEK